MNTVSFNQNDSQRSASRIASMGRKLKRKISNLFRPEVVEVTFRMDGDNLSYTYTKVPEKQVA